MNLFAKLFFTIVFILFSQIGFGQSSTATYSGGDIPTGDDGWPGTGVACTASTLQVNIPIGATVTGVDVAYNMTAATDGWMSEQRSQIYYLEGATYEGGYISGLGNSTATYNYNRTGLSLADGVSNTGILTFEMHAYRTWGGSDCNTTYNKVDDGSWTITVHYTPVDPCDALASGNTDTDGDNVSDICDLDDDNDGILDTDEIECVHVQANTFSVTNGATETFILPSASGGFTIEISSFDNSFNMTINGVKLVPNELQFQSDVYQSGVESFARFASDNTAYGESGNSLIWQLNQNNADPSKTIIKIIIDGSGNISFQGIRTITGALEDLIIEPTDPQFNTVTWNSTGTNTVVVSQKVAGPTYLYATGYGEDCNQDNDNDGIINSLDLDSDNDGCPDAIEGAGTYVLADLTNDMITAAVDVDGVPRNGGSQAIGSSRDLRVVVCCDAAASGYPDNDGDNIANQCDEDYLVDDFDGDGVFDYDDLDDDNDGILDVDECVTSGRSENLFAGVTFLSGGGDATNIVINDYLLASKSLNYLEVDYDVVIKITGRSSITGQNIAILNNSSSALHEAITIEGVSASQNAWFTYSLSIVVSSSATSIKPTGTPALIPNVWVTQSDIDGSANNLGDVGGYSNSNAPEHIIFGSVLSATTWTEGPSGYTFYSPTILPSAGINALPVDYSVAAEYFYSDFTNGSEFVFGFKGTDGGSTTRGQVLYMRSELVCDLDNDNIPDVFDKDSDNDGCPDAIEGSKFYNYEDLDNDMLKGNVDADGVPTIGSQAFGDSKNANADGCATLPVELISFKAIKNNNSVDLTWSTASEINNDYFLVQKSDDNVNFETIESVDGNGNSNVIINYFAIDNNPYSGVNYYRLLQVDYDGTQDYSNTIAVNFIGENEIIVYPNPTTGIINIEGASNFQLMVYTPSAELLINTKIDNSDLYNLDLSNLSKGVYIIHLTSNCKTEVKRVIVR